MESGGKWKLPSEEYEKWTRGKVKTGWTKTEVRMSNEMERRNKAAGTALGWRWGKSRREGRYNHNHNTEPDRDWLTGTWQPKDGKKGGKGEKKELNRTNRHKPTQHAASVNHVSRRIARRTLGRFGLWYPVSRSAAARMLGHLLPFGFSPSLSSRPLPSGYRLISVLTVVFS